MQGGSEDCFAEEIKRDERKLRGGTVMLFFFSLSRERERGRMRDNICDKRACPQHLFL